MSSRSNLAELTLRRPFQTLTVLVPELDCKHSHASILDRNRTGTPVWVVPLSSAETTRFVPSSSGSARR